MIIGFDGKRAVSNMTGLGNYSRLVIESLADAYPDNEHLIYAPRLKDNPRLHKIETLPNVKFRLPTSRIFKGSLWRTFGLSRQLAGDNVHLYHGLSNELPLNIRSSGVPGIVTIHDVIYRRLPHCYSAADRVIYDYKYGRSCVCADRIIAVSECTKKDIIEFYGIPDEKIDVVYQGCNDAFKTKLSPPVLEAKRRELLLPERFILQVGTIEERKNLELTVRALSALPPDVWLVAIGRDRNGYRQKVSATALQLGVANRIMWRSDISGADLPAVNQMAAAVAYPSRYEGFGIPILEALESETPVVAATGSCLEEAGGSSSIYVNPDDAVALGQALNAILDKSLDVVRMIGDGKKHAHKFTNSTMATRLMEVYNKAIK